MRLRHILSKEIYSIVGLIIAGLAMHLWGADKVLDTKLYYTVTQAESFFRSLEASQWQAYLLNEVLDLVFLSNYSLLFFLLARKFYLKKTWFAFIPGVFDLIENSTIILLLIYRHSSPPSWLGYVTCMKWLTGAVVVIWIIFEFTKASRRGDKS